MSPRSKAPIARRSQPKQPTRAVLNWKKAAPFLIFYLLGWLLYLPSLHGPFIYDDYPHLVDNFRLQNAATLKEVVFSGYQETRPLFLLSMFVSYKLVGLSPFWFHLFSLLTHLANAILFLVILMRLDAVKPLLPKLKPAWRTMPLYAMATVFLIHPLQTESVSYINSRSGLQMGFFVLLSLLSFIEFRRAEEIGGKAKSYRCYWYAASLIAMVASMLSKENGAVAPLLVLTIDLLFFRKAAASWTQRAATHVPLLATLLTLPLLFHFFRNPHVGTIGGLVADKTAIVLTEPRVISYFISSFFLPLWQNIDYDFALTRSPLEIGFILPLLALGLLLTAAVLVARRRPWTALGLLWFFIALAPTNSVVPFFDFVAERHLYLSIAGAAIALMSFGDLWKNHQQMQAAGIVILLWLGCLGAWTVTRNNVWSSEVALWRDSSEKSPKKLRPLFNLGSALADSGNYAEAATVLERYLTLDPENSRATYNLATVYRLRRDCASAMPFYQRALALDTNYVGARIGLAHCLAKGGDHYAALKVIRTGLDKETKSPDPKLLVWGARYAAQSGAISDAEKLLLTLVATAPQMKLPYIELGNFYQRLHMRPQAMAAYRQAAQLSGVGPAELDATVEQLMKDTPDLLGTLR